MKSKRQQSKGYSSPGKGTVKRATKSPGGDSPSSRYRAAAGKPLLKALAANLPSRSPEKPGLAQPGREAFSIVGVGASAGGLEAFMELGAHWQTLAPLSLCHSR
jgi:chemotaxis response regulator CheB